MFKICKLIMYSMEEDSFTYEFEFGINYFKGKNSSGKTEFYSFIDFMFGSSEDIRKKPWYADSLKKATMIFEFENIKYCISRTRDPNQNYFYYFGDDESESIDLREYKDKLMAIFARDKESLKSIHNFTNEELTYRTFTMFNFLGEKGQGKIHNFFDKCSDIKYSVKLNPILNFIFNNNLEEIFNLQKELELLTSKIKELEVNYAKYEFILKQVNKNLQILGGNLWFTGKNTEDIRKHLSEIKNMQNINNRKYEKNIADMQVMFNNISEQIKVYENSSSDLKQFEKDNLNRKILLEKLAVLINENGNLDYLIKPLQSLLTDIENSISFSKYIISDNTIKELIKQRESLRTEIKRNDSRFKMYTMEEKSKAIALIEDYLSAEVQSNEEELIENKKKVREIREKLRVLQSTDDSNKIKELSKYITNLYFSAKDISSVVDADIIHEGFKIQYIKSGNILQPVIARGTENDDVFNKKEDVNYYIGSMARHTLIQLCGYLGFLNILLADNKYPLIPILVIDHISKPFDQKNSKAIGKVISKAYESIGKKNLQIFMFDNDEFETLAIMPDHFENLIVENKTGFNPFFIPNTVEFDKK